MGGEPIVWKQGIGCLRVVALNDSHINTGLAKLGYKVPMLLQSLVSDLS